MSDEAVDRNSLPASGWGLVLVAALAMGIAGFYQFGWSSIRLPLGSRLQAPEAALGTVFTLFVVFQTIAQFPAGWVRDRYGPRLPLGVGAVFLSAGFAGVALAQSLPGAYLAYVAGGIGVAVVYTVTVNTAVKWFTERRALATGIVTMAYSGGSFLLIPVVRGQLEVAFERTLFILAVVAGVIALAAALVLRDPRTGGESSASAKDSDRSEIENSQTNETVYTWREAVRTWQFWLLYAVLIIVNGVGLMVIGKVVSYASQLSLPPSAATASASLVALADAAGILVLGGLSDRLGYRLTVAASLALAGLALGGAVIAGEQGLALWFVAGITAAAFFRSPPFSVFPTLVGEYYGRQYSSENYAALYTAKLFGGVIGGTVASALVVTIGWSTSFAIGAGLLVVAGAAMMFLRPV